MTSDEKILQKRLIAAGLSSEDWDRVSAGLKDRAFFSSRIQNVRFLQGAQNGIADLLARAQNAEGAITSRPQLVSDLMRLAREEHIATGTGGLTDPGSPKRAAVVVDTNAAMASGWVSWTVGNTQGARAAYPAQQLVRISPRIHTRPWVSRWIGAGGQLYGGKMIALKDDPIWVNISRFGNPWPPYDFNSGMGVRDVSFDTCVELGLLDKNWLPPDNDPVEDFNAHLQDELTFKGANDPLWRWLQAQFGDQVKYSDGKIVWQADLIHARLASWEADKTFRQVTRLGVATDDATAAAKGVADLGGKQLSIPAETLGHIKERHYGANETDPRSVPLTDNDIGLIPFVWRNPDKVVTDGDALLIYKKAADGNWFCMVVDQFGGGLHLKTFYKEKAGASGLPASL